MTGRVACILLAIAAAVAFRADLYRMYLYRADRNFRSGDFASACNAWQKASALNSTDSTVRYNRGAGYYRMGKFDSALEDFTAATSGTGPDLQFRAWYNRANCLLRLGWQNAAGNPAVAGRFYDQALDSYRMALTLKPGDRDTLANLAVVSEAKSTLSAQSSFENTPGAHHPAASKTDTSRPVRSRGKDDLNSLPADSSMKSGGQPTSDNRDHPGTGVESMGRDQAERLLNEKRWQEVLPSAVRAVPGQTSPARPLKDW